MAEAEAALLACVALSAHEAHWMVQEAAAACQEPGFADSLPEAVKGLVALYPNQQR